MKLAATDWFGLNQPMKRILLPQGAGHHRSRAVSRTERVVQVIERRTVVIALGVQVIGVPLLARAQQPTELARDAVLATSSPETRGLLCDAFETAPISGLTQ
jgi:hypothetical protein